MRPTRSVVSTTVALLAALALAGCGDDGDTDAADTEPSGLAADADALIDCLADADVTAAVDDAHPLGVEEEVVQVEVNGLPSDLLLFDSGSGTEMGVAVYLFEDDAAALDSRTAITLATEDDDDSWVDGRAVVSWWYPVDREHPTSQAVDDCVATLDDA